VPSKSRKPFYSRLRLSSFLGMFGSKASAAVPTPPSSPVLPIQQRNLDEARALKQQQRLGEALALCRQILAAQPGDIDASLLAAEISVALGDRDQAVAMYSGVIELRPDQSLAYYKRGNIFKDREQRELALADYDRAIALDPGYAYALCNRGVVLSRLNRLEAALDSFDRAITAAPHDAIAFCNRADVLRELKRSDEALASYDRALSIQPNHLESHFNRGLLLSEHGRFAEALVSLDNAAALKPDHAEVHLSRANVLHKLGQYDEAIQAYARVLACDPKFRFVRGLLQHNKMFICDWDGVATGIEQIVAGIGRGESVSTPFAVLSLVDDPSLHQKAAQIWVRVECPPSSALPVPRARGKSEKLRIGYFSGDFYDHPVSSLSVELFESHDRSRFEIAAFSFGPDKPGPMRRRLESAFDRFVDVRDRSDRDVALLARSYEIDIAVDLSGHTIDSRTGILAQRAAPLQVGYLGYPGTMGADYIDYLIGDPTIIPVENQPHCSEKIVYLPYSYLPHDSTRAIDAKAPTRGQAGLPAEGFVFCCFNNSYKITPDVFSCWMRILARVDGSVLWLPQNNPFAARNLRREAELRGVDPLRLIFADRAPSISQHLARLGLADLFLDTLPYNAHATAIDALWASLPIVTCIGRAFAGRVGASLLRTLELPELVTMSLRQYEDLAVDLATNPTRMAAIKQRVARNRLTTPLFDSRSFVLNLEAAYGKIHERHHAGLPPDHIHVGDATNLTAITARR
jgi:predicted O-linked N-acetylglucosamine transferase (SPINDLY family)